MKFTECSKKISLSGKVLCVFGNDTINYASSGKKALHNHDSCPTFKTCVRVHGQTHITSCPTVN